MARCQYLGEAPVTGNVYAALSMTEIDDADLATEFMAGMTSFTEYDGAGYARQLLVIADVTPGAAWRLRSGAPTDFGTPSAGTTPAVALVLYQGTSALPAGDATARVMGWLQGPEIGFLPFQGDGATLLSINWPAGGTIITGPNC